MKRLPNGIPILYQQQQTVEFTDAFGEGKKYTKTFTVTLVWHKGFHWGISTGDFSCWDKRLSKCVIFALRILETDGSPRYYRLKDHLINKGIWRNL